MLFQRGMTSKPLSAGGTPGTGSRQGCPSDPWVCLCGTIEETGEILILLTLMCEFPSLFAMGDLWPSMVLGCSFLSWQRCRRKSVVDFIGGWGGGRPEVHLITVAPLCENGPLPHRLIWLRLLRSLNSCCHCLKESLLLDS